MHAVYTPRVLLAGAATTYAAVFAAFVLLEQPGLGVGHFYYPAIALVALALGPAWGAAGGTLAALLYVIGVYANSALPSSEILTVSTPIRFLNFVAIGTLLGWFATHYRSANAELQILAQRDLITGLPNTRAFELAINRRFDAGEPFALLVGDLDSLRFEGDRPQALRRTADVLTQGLGADADVARVGAEEFAVLIACSSVEGAAQLATRLERNLCESGSLVTFGWSAFPREGENALTLYRAAGERLYARRVLRDPRRSTVLPVAV